MPFQSNSFSILPWFVFLCFNLVWTTIFITTTTTTTTTTTVVAFTTTTPLQHHSYHSHTATQLHLIDGNSNSLLRKLRTFQRQYSPFVVERLNTLNNMQTQEQEDQTPSLPLLKMSSLAGPFRVDIQVNNNNNNNVLVWSLIPIHQLQGITNEMPVGTQAMKALALHQDPIISTTTTEASSPLPFITLQCQQQQEDNSHLTVTATTHPENNDNNKDYADIAGVLSRIMVQQYSQTFALLDSNKNNNASYKITFPSFGVGKDSSTLTTTTTIELDSLVHDKDIYKLFLGDEYDVNDASLELVEMVAQSHQDKDNDNDNDNDTHHQILGIVPRPLVHSHNLLHRGIGVVVTRGKPIPLPPNSQQQQQEKLPSLYTHRRTSTKRIFPSLYDMFVGGVSAAKEDSTCTVLRELQEELNLGNPSHLSSALFECTVCTSYNRCHVTVFGYTCSSEEESQIQWQKEEVAWGEFVPYDIIERAASYSIQRFQQSNTWPGTYPIYEEHESHDDGVVEHTNNGKEEEEDWKHWDFVPDGLLVWNAWVQWYHTKL